MFEKIIDSLGTAPAVTAAIVGVAGTVAVALLALIAKLVGNYIAEKQRQATNVRVLATYIDLAIESWDEQDITAAPESRTTGFRIAIFDKIVDKTTRIPNINGAGGELYTPFVPFSAQDDLTIGEVRDLIGFLNQREIAAVARFVELEALTHAVAKDFRSEHVRRVFTQARKVGLLESFNDTLVRARCAAEHARGALAPFKDCPVSVWYLPGGPSRQRRHYYFARSFSQCQLDKSAVGCTPCGCFKQQPEANPQPDQP